MPVLRQITSCQAPATTTLTRHTSARTLLWQGHVCHRHRHLLLQLTGASNLNSRATRPAPDPAPRCGTLHDHQPIDQAIESHARMWLQTPAEGTWAEQLTAAAALAVYTGDPQADALTEIARAAEDGPAARVLELLAQVETAAAVAARR
ncbi:hypothetical protein AB0M23_28475 [Streptomyces sp. NPDC052077]|uniref:hypothetical protein n=1 Tax=Streptomyces sp. NPDC052077 TaxID=3154757 RepID=UPI003432BA23